MSDNNPGSDQFSLVSLDKSQQAASSYSNMSRRAKGESDSTLDVNEDEAKEKLAPPKPPPPPKPKAKDGKDGKDGDKPKKKPAPVRSEDAMDQSLDDILARLEEFNRSVKLLMSNASVAARNIALVMITPLLPLLNFLLKLLNIPLHFINLLARKINQRMGGKSGQTVSASGEVVAEAAAEPEAPPEPEPVAAKSSNFSDMLELNILFTDNMKKPLYKKKPGMAQRMGAMEEDLILSNAMLAIAECAE
ncbi:MAG: hypothetical protein ACAI44_07015, partial [Candidatus Sericytochromatia bacterium]